MIINMKIKNSTLLIIVLMSLVIRALASTPDTLWISWLTHTNTNVDKTTLRNGWLGIRTKIPLVSWASQIWYCDINNCKQTKTINTLWLDPRETLRFEGNKMNSFPRDQSLSDLLYSWKFWSRKLIKTRCYGADILAGNSFIARCHVTSRNQWERALLGRIFSYTMNELMKSRGWEDNRRAILQYILTCEQ